MSKKYGLIMVLLLLNLSGCANLMNSQLKQPTGAWENVNPPEIQKMGIK